ncbi:hypothetical protein QYF36_012364 [Acer negundo]|nr:hypothetical protein QYF36_012364 [Acer negundo]
MPTLHRVGSCFPPLSIACHDIYDNRIPFASLPEVLVKLKTSKSVSIYVHKFKTHLSADRLTLNIKMFDAYSNHVEEGLEVELNVDGFCSEDPFGLKRKVDDCGCIDLGGLLKVTAGYGRSASFSVLSENEIIFMQEFQTENRELRVSSGVPECCTAGSLLEDVVFEIVDSKGDIDVTVHDDEKSGQSHTLTIKSASISMEDSIRYAFRHGRCSVPAIPLPLNEGLFCIVAAHSIPVVEAPEVKPEIQASSSSKMVVPLEASPSLKNVDNLMMTFVDNEKEIVKYGLQIKKYEDKSKVLNDQKARIEQLLFGLEEERYVIYAIFLEEEEKSPYTGLINGSDLQRRLALPDPILPSSNVPLGFLGYAVNMVNLDGHHLRTMTLAGYGLRETLFYRLFGKLQIYGTCEYMIQARACIKYGAVSLDGGILRENGIISLGHGNPEICFPVVLSDAEMHMSPEITKKLKEIEKCKSELDKTECSIKGNSIAHEKSLKKFHKKKDKYTKLLNSIEPVRLEYQSDVKKNLEICPK